MFQPGNIYIYFAWELFTTGEGVCDDFAALFAYMARSIGFDARVTGGHYVNLDGSRWVHTWTAIVIDGRWYFFDPQIEASSLKANRHNPGWSARHWWRQPVNAALTQSRYDSRHDFAHVPAPPASSLPFADVRWHDWFYPSVAFVYNHDLMRGTSQTAFSPNSNLNRAMVVTILWRIAMEPDVRFQAHFSDVQPGRWYSEAVTWAFEEGVVDGVGGGRFAPNDPITRQQLAVMVHRFEQFFEDSDIHVPGHVQTPPGTADWAREAMRWATYHNFITASNPGARASRAETAAFVHRYILQFFVV